MQKIVRRQCIIAASFCLHVWITDFQFSTTSLACMLVSCQFWTFDFTIFQRDFFSDSKVFFLFSRSHQATCVRHSGSYNVLCIVSTLRGIAYSGTLFFLLFFFFFFSWGTPRPTLWRALSSQTFHTTREWLRNQERVSWTVKRDTCPFPSLPTITQLLISQPSYQYLIDKTLNWWEFCW